METNFTHNQSPRVSVILPTRDGEKYLERAIKSVLDQNFEDFELLIMDDGSQRPISHFLKNLQDPRIKIFRQENSLGLQKTLNKGLREARGLYIARIDDDDYWNDPTKLQKQVEFLDAHPDHFLVGTWGVVIEQNGKLLKIVKHPLTDHQIKERILSNNLFIHVSVLYRKEPVLNRGGYSENPEVKYQEDYDLWLDLGRYFKFANLPIPATTYTIHAFSSTSRNKIIQQQKTIKLIFKYRKFYPNFFRAMVRATARLIIDGYLNLTIARYKLESIVSYRTYEKFQIKNK